jgi:signal transduction histidine kinase
VLEAALALSSEHELEGVLGRVVAEARRVARARYVALAVYEEDGALWRFVHEGLDAAAAAAIASCPVGRGLLAVVKAANAPVRVDDIAADTRSCGFPGGHPEMRRLLGAPVATGRRRHGSLYLCDRDDGSAFDASDEDAIAVFAELAAAAIESALLIRAERDRAEARAERAAAQASETAQRDLLARVIAAQEAERARVSRDLHDEIGQALTSVLLGLRLIDDTARPDAGVAGDERGDRLEEVRSLVADALERVRSLAFELRPTVLDDVGLVPALERLTTEVADRSAVAVDLTVRGLDDPRRLPGEVETVLYRVVQEALTNAVRHANASVVSVLIVAGAGLVRAVIEDDGHGFDPGASHHSLGLAGMRERVMLVGGTLRIDSSPGSGTTLVAEVPVG